MATPRTAEAETNRPNLFKEFEDWRQNSDIGGGTSQGMQPINEEIEDNANQDLKGEGKFFLCYSIAIVVVKYLR